MAHDDLIGAEIAGRYRVVRLIGRGGMGSVYEVVHKELGRRFALKTLSLHLAQDGEALRRFRREAEAIAGLDHPNIIEVVDWDVLASGIPCMVLEFLRGENLASRIGRRGQLDWATIASIGDQVLAALEAAHRCGVVHRDLKPQNVFLAENDSGDTQVKLLDFGVSKVRSAQGFETADDRLIGTPAFMAPEQAAGRPAEVGPQSDVWAMGAVLFMMATGKPPFAGTNIPQILYRICHGDPPLLRDARPDASPQFTELVTRALSRDPAARLITARALREGLRDALSELRGAAVSAASGDSSSYRRGLPTGTITFLFTDIEGSTRLWERHPESMNELVARHDAVMRAEIESHGGWVFKTVGDGVYAAFGEPLGAAFAATAGQQEVAAMGRESGAPLRVRMAIHTGPAHQRGGDYFGPTLNRVARVLSLAHGGQTLVTDTTAALLRAELPERYDLQDLGIYRLPDLTRPERVHQLVHPDLPMQFDTLRTPARTRTNLPRPLSSFVGRAKECDELGAGLEKNRLVTITGPGGCGKTRLALKVAAGQTSRFPDGVWFVELASITDGALVAQTVAEATDLVREGLMGSSAPWHERLARQLEDKRVLLVLDNCEHVTRDCSALVASLLSRCGDLSVLTTSREPLGVTGEMLYAVPPLAVASEEGQGQDLAAAERLDAVRLFVDRARLVQSSFALTEDNLPVVLRICRQLDGIPLALELAAARLTVLPIEGIDERLRDRFSLLRRADSGTPERQRSLRGLLDWSYELLDHTERALLARLATFRGTFSLAAAESIGSQPPVRQADVLDLLDQLAHKSLIHRSRDAGEPRYRLLETVREYAQEKLAESGEEAAVRRRHCAWYADLAERLEPELRSRNQTSALDLLEAESDNLRGALAWANEAAEVGQELRLVGALWWFWIIRGHISEGRRHLDRALEKPASAEEPPAPRARALAGCGLLTVLSDLGRAKSLLDEALALARAAKEPRETALAMFGLGLQSLFSGDLPGAHGWLDESRQAFSAASDDWGIGMASMFLGPVSGFADREAGEAACREAVSAFERAGDRVGLAYALVNSGEIPRVHGDDEQAARLYEKGLALCREVGDRTGTVISLANLGMALSSSEPTRADECLRESLALAQEIGVITLAPHCLLGLAGVAVAGAQWQRAAQLLGASSMLKEAVAAQFHPADQVYFERVFFELREHLEEATRLAEWKRGEELSPDAAIAFARSRGLLRAGEPA